MDGKSLAKLGDLVPDVLRRRSKTIRVDRHPGRNKPCPCGSGKKAKRCHYSG